MTSSASKNATTSPCGDKSKNHVIDKNQTCPHCGNPIGFSPQSYQCPDFPNVSLFCQSCGKKDTDLSGFYIIDKINRSLASPGFSTLEETKQFADIFGMSKQSGYGLCEFTMFFNHQRDEKERREELDRLAWSHQVLTRLIELQPACRGTEDLKSLAVSLGLNDYALPLFRAPSTTAEIG